MAWVWLIIFILMYTNNLIIIKRDKAEADRLDIKTINYFIIIIISIYSIKIGFILAITMSLIKILPIKEKTTSKLSVKLAEYSITLTYIAAGFIVWAVPLGLIISNQWVIIILSTILGILTVKIIVDR